MKGPRLPSPVGGRVFRITLEDEAAPGRPAPAGPVLFEGTATLASAR